MTGGKVVNLAFLFENPGMANLTFLELVNRVCTSPHTNLVKNGRTSLKKLNVHTSELLFVNYVAVQILLNAQIDKLLTRFK